MNTLDRELISRQNASSIPFLPTFLLVFLSLTSPLFAAGKNSFDREISRQKHELDELHERLQSEKKELESLHEKKANTLGELDKLSDHIHLTEQYLKQLEKTEETLSKALEGVKEDLREIEGRIQERNGIMAQRVRTLYMNGSPDRFILQGWKIGQGDFMRKVFFMKRVVRYDKTLVKASLEDLDLKKQSMAKMDLRMGDLLRFRQYKAKEKETFSQEKKEQEKNLASIQLDESQKQAALSELEENARLINEIIIALEKRRKEELANNKKATELEKGSRYCLPVEGDVVSKYGIQYHATLKTSTKNLGIEIRGKSGAKVHAAVSGVVALITRIPGYGLGVILDNGSDYFTIYANLAGISVSQGDKVSTCQDIGSISVESGRVYFEVRKGTKTIDPEAWLRSSVASHK